MTPVTSPIRLIAIDIDGTLLDSQFKIPPANISALRRAHELGVEIALVTGRRHSFALPIAEMLGFDVASSVPTARLPVLSRAIFSIAICSRPPLHVKLIRHMDPLPRQCGRHLRH